VTEKILSPQNKFRLTPLGAEGLQMFRTGAQVTSSSLRNTVIDQLSD